MAGGSLRAMEAILRGDVEHAHHPGGGLHHAMPDRASGFCIYDDPALAIARARQRGLRVLYLDFDVHHGDGVQALHWDDPGVLTVSFHEIGRVPFPGTGVADESGEGPPPGTPSTCRSSRDTGEGPWLAAVRCWCPRSRRPSGPTSSCRSTAPTRMPGSAGAPAGDDDGDGRGGPARRPVAHRWRAAAGWRPAAAATTPTGGAAGVGAGLAGRGAPEPPRRPPRRGGSAGRPRRARTGRRRCPATFDDPPNAGHRRPPPKDRRSRIEGDGLAVQRSWCRESSVRRGSAGGRRGCGVARRRGEGSRRRDGARRSPAVIASSGARPCALECVSRTRDVAGGSRGGHALLLAALADGGTSVSAAVDGGSWSVWPSPPLGRRPPASIVAGVGRRPGSPAPGLRRTAPRCARGARAGATWEATVTVAERDWVDPLDVTLRTIDREAAPGARRVRASRPVPPSVARIDPWALQLERRGG